PSAPRSKSAPFTATGNRSYAARTETASPFTFALGPLLPRVEVLVLLRRELVDLDVHGPELETRDLPIDLDRDRVDLLLERRVVLHHPFHRQRLVRERHVHVGGRATLGRCEVTETDLTEVDALPSFG